MTVCPYCGQDPYEYVDVGVGHVPVAVTCCEFGVMHFQFGYNAKQVHKAMRVMHRQEKAIALREQWIIQHPEDREVLADCARCRTPIYEDESMVTAFRGGEAIYFHECCHDDLS